MSSEPWFHHDPIPDPALGEPERVELDSKQARHATGARRLAPGDEVVLFDGRGVSARAVIEEVSRRCTTVRVSALQRESPATPRIHLASALPKGDRQSAMLAMTCALGLASFAPLECGRSVARAGSGSRDRWQRILQESCKQSRRAHLPELRESCTPQRYLELHRKNADATFLLDPAGRPARQALADGALHGALDLHLLVGPEGGFEDSEIQALRGRDAQPISLGAGILRIETAAVAAVATFALLQDV